MSVSASVCHIQIGFRQLCSGSSSTSLTRMRESLQITDEIKWTTRNKFAYVPANAKVKGFLDVSAAAWMKSSNSRPDLYADISQDVGANRSAPKGRQQMGETGFCKNLRLSAVSCESLRFPALFCANLRLPKALIYRAQNQRKSAKICENVRSGFLPFAVSLFGAP